MSDIMRYRIVSDTAIWIDNHRYLPGEYIELSTTAAKYLLLSDVIEDDDIEVPNEFERYNTGDYVVIFRNEQAYVLSIEEISTFFSAFLASSSSGTANFSDPNNSGLIAALVA